MAETTSFISFIYVPIYTKNSEANVPLLAGMPFTIYTFYTSCQLIQNTLICEKIQFKT